MFRICATRFYYFPVLQQLIANKEALGLDIHSKGKESEKNALDLAVKYNNEKAKQLLENLGLSPNPSA